MLWLSSEQQSYFWKHLWGDVVHALLVTHRTAAARQDSSQLNRSRMKMKVTKKSNGVKQNGSMAYRQEGTYWSGQGAQRLFNARWSLCKKNTERRKKNSNKTKIQTTCQQSTWEIWDMKGWVRGWHCRAESEAKIRMNWLKGLNKVQPMWNHVVLHYIHIPADWIRNQNEINVLNDSFICGCLCPTVPYNVVSWWLFRRRLILKSNVQECRMEATQFVTVQLLNRLPETSMRACSTIISNKIQWFSNMHTVALWKFYI